MRRTLKGAVAVVAISDSQFNRIAVACDDPEPRVPALPFPLRAGRQVMLRSERDTAPASVRALWDPEFDANVFGKELASPAADNVERNAAVGAGNKHSR